MTTTINITRFLSQIVCLMAAGGLVVTAEAATSTYQLTLKNGVATGFFEADKGDANANGQIPGIRVEQFTVNGVELRPFTFRVVVADVQSEKPGTAGQLECLDQGPNVVGVRRTAVNNIADVGVPATRWFEVTFAFPGFQNGCPGEPDFTGSRTYRIQEVSGFNNDTPIGPPILGDYHVANTNTVPEPEMLLLFLTGAGALVAIRRRRHGNRRLLVT